jgi:hypothetical protein
MYVYVETTTDIQSLTSNKTQFLYEDKVHFSDAGEVTLLTLVQDAVFMYPTKNTQGIKEIIPLGVDEQGNNIGVEGFYLDDEELLFTNKKPYVVYGYIGVGSGKTVTFEAGARVHFHENSGIIVGTGGTMIVNGEESIDKKLMEGEVVFEGDRLEPGYENIPGQWGAIWLTSGSTQHQFHHATIKNATVGILMDFNDETNDPTLTISNSQIHNSAAANLWGKTAYIVAKNTVFGNAGQYSFIGSIGGDYKFTHCTFSNYWEKSFRSTPAVLINDYTTLSDGTNFIKPLKNVTFENCIIDGNQLIEFYVEQQGNEPINFNLDHTSIKFESSNNSVNNNPFFDWTNSVYNQLYRNLEAAFVGPEKNDMRINQKSEFIEKGDIKIGLTVPKDLIGEQRNYPPDLGAYQHIQFEN